MSSEFSFAVKYDMSDADVVREPDVMGFLTSDDVTKGAATIELVKFDLASKKASSFALNEFFTPGMASKKASVPISSPPASNPVSLSDSLSPRLKSTWGGTNLSSCFFH